MVVKRIFVVITGISGLFVLMELNWEPQIRLKEFESFSLGLWQDDLESRRSL